jgi:hypothetical protein
MVLCHSCDDVPLKGKKKNGRASSLPAGFLKPSIGPSYNLLDNTFNIRI